MSWWRCMNRWRAGRRDEDGSGKGDGRDWWRGRRRREWVVKSRSLAALRDDKLLRWGEPAGKKLDRRGVAPIELGRGGSGWSKLSSAYRFGTGVLVFRIEIMSCADGGMATSRVSTSSLAGILEP